MNFKAKKRIIPPTVPPVEEPKESIPLGSNFTPREREVFDLISQGYESRSIATALNISIKTLDTHYDRIKKKTNVDGGLEGLRYLSTRHYFEKNIPEIPSIPSLTKRQKELFLLLGKKPQSASDLGEELNLSLKTIESHLFLLKRRLGLERTDEVKRLAIQYQYHSEKSKTNNIYLPEITLSSTRTDLSLRQKEVFDLIREGLSTEAITSKLNISRKTTEAHYNMIKEKLGLDSMEKVHRYAFKEGLENRLINFPELDITDFSSAQLEIFTLLSRESARDIAKKLYRSLKTVNTHMDIMIEKLRNSGLEVDGYRGLIRYSIVHDYRSSSKGESNSLEQSVA